MFTTIARYHDPLEAHLACGRLRAEGVDAHLADEETMLGNWEWRLALGGVRLQVPEEDVARARFVLRELEAGAFALDTAETDAATQAAGLHPPDRETISSRIAWVAFILFCIPLPWRRRYNENASREL